MESGVERFLWPALILAILAYGVNLFWGSVIAETEKARNYEITVLHSKDQRGHFFRGMITVPSHCHDLHVESYATSINHRHFQFTTKKVSTCEQDPEPRAFSIFVPRFDRGEIITGSLDGEPLSLTIRSL